MSAHSAENSAASVDSAKILVDAEMAMRERAPQRAAAAASRAVSMRQADFDAGPSLGNRALLVDALLALASAQLAMGDHASAESALDEIQLHLEHGVRSDREWAMRASAVTRIRIAAAQGADRHDEAVAIIEAVIASIPGQSPDADAGRLQLITTLLRSRMALGQAVEAEADIAQANSILARLGKVMPSRAADVTRASLLLHSASVALLRQDAPGADAKFGQGLGILDRLGGSDLNELRQQFVQSWVRALNLQGRTAEAGALLMRGTSGPAFGSGHAQLDGHPDQCACCAH
jgi:hypothetical protein